MILIKVC